MSAQCPFKRRQDVIKYITGKTRLTEDQVDANLTGPHVVINYAHGNKLIRHVITCSGFSYLNTAQLDTVIHGISNLR